MLDLSISDSDYEDYPESHASTVDLTMLDDTTLDELYVNLDSHPVTRDSMDEVHWGNTIKTSRYIQDLQQPAVKRTAEFGLLLAKKSNRHERIRHLMWLLKYCSA